MSSAPAEELIGSLDEIAAKAHAQVYRTASTRSSA